MLKLRENTPRHFWTGFAISGIIPLTLALLPVLGFLKASTEGLLTWKGIFLFGGLFVYVAGILSLGHLQTYNHHYKFLERPFGHFSGFGELFMSWWGKNALWQAHGFSTIPFIVIYLVSLLMSDNWIKDSDLNGATEMAFNAGMAVLPIFAIILYIIFYGLIVVFLFSLPMALVSSLAFRWRCLKNISD